MIRLYSLQSLRFIFTLVIFISHYNITGNWGIYGSVGVSYFMILSGFVISIGYNDKVVLPEFNYKHFMLKRLSRLWPLHMFCLIVMVVLNAFVGNEPFTLKEIMNFILNVLMLQSWVPHPSVFYSFNRVSWFLTDVVFFYALYPYIVKMIHSIKREWTVIVSVGILFLYIATYSVIPNSYESRFLYISPLFRLTDFILGIALYSAYKFISVDLSDKLQTLSFTKRTVIEEQ